MSIPITQRRSTTKRKPDPPGKDWKNPTPVAVCLIRVRHSGIDHALPTLLAVKRGIPPHIGELAFPGGFVNEMETVEQAAARELEEETGVCTSADDWTIVGSRVTPTNRLLVFCLCRLTVTHNEVEAAFETILEEHAHETLGLDLVDEYDELCFPLHTEFLKKVELWR